jgi:hypothetical protein
MRKCNDVVTLYYINHLPTVGERVIQYRLFLYILIEELIRSSIVVEVDGESFRHWSGTNKSLNENQQQT